MENQKLEVAEIQLTYRPIVRPQDRLKIKSAYEAYRILLESWNSGKIEFIEQFKLMLLNRNNKVLGIYTVSTGGLAGCMVDMKLVFPSALLSCALAIILAHNHPSGNLRPSLKDLTLTKRIKEAGKVLEIEVQDHIIVTKDGYYSFADENNL